MKAPCNGCESRLVGCHTFCKDYQEWKKEYQAAKDAKRSEVPELCRRMKKLLWRRMLRR